MVEVFINGTGGRQLLANRHLCSAAIRYNGKIILLDCGEATSIAFSKSGWSYKDISAIFISHRHADHTAGLPAILLAMKNAGRDDPLTIFCEISTHNKVRAAIELAAENLYYDINIIVIDETTQPFYFDKDVKLSFVRLVHSIGCYGIKFTINRPAKFDPKKASRFSIPVSWWSRIQKGETYVDEDSISYSLADVSCKERKNISICYIPDTAPAALRTVNKFIKDSELVLMECMYANKDDFNNQENKEHLCLDDIISRECGLQTSSLGLLHFSPAYKNINKAYSSKIKSSPNTFLCKDGQLIQIKFPD